ncbi:hypothetical protein AAFP30_14655 [Gordonia sp. CPCC 205515]
MTTGVIVNVDPRPLPLRGNEFYTQDHVELRRRELHRRASVNVECRSPE